MSVHRKHLLCCDEIGTLKTLLLGVAAELDMEFCEIPSSLSAMRELTAKRMQSVLVIGAKDVCQAALDLIKGVEAISKAPPLLVVTKNLSDESRARAYQAGAMQCFSLDEAVGSLAAVVKSIVNHLYGDDSAAGLWQLGNDYTLTAPDYIVSNGTVVTKLTVIQGRLLQCLASKPNQLVTYPELMKYAWGRPEFASVNNLHQQMFRLRSALDQGVVSSITCVRGRGYRFAFPESDPPQICSI